jgi:enamine deaminase RidA (YjgF/YER057c/UK114 family)
MADIQRINPPGLAPPPNNRYAHVVRSGDRVWIAGQTARDASGALVGRNNAVAQAKKAYANLRTAIESVGGTYANIVKVTIFVTSEGYLPAARAAQDDVWGDNPLPASSMIIVKALARPEFFIEIEAEGVLDG